ncbi:hypothetical protein NIA11_13875 [Lachnospira eligens]|uniref:hypothetical protein n=1 Tax=Lachnospira eligens TaxID=39485 RepID=UPI002097E4A4|nr:hypothetical protein [Lachnospira eligens]MCO7144725.1 hypothetical protein [Lachnospira eligens]
MVQIKQKSNKINITALITCFMLIVVFVFGCAQFAFASDDMTLEQYIEKYPVQYYVLTRSDHANGTKNGFYSWACDFETTPGRVCAVLTAEGNMSSGVAFYADTPRKTSYYWSSGWYSWGGDAPSANSDGIYPCGGGSTAIKKVNEYLTNVVLFSNYEDAKTYILTGQINNSIYKPSGSYDENIPTPKNLEIYFDRKLNKPFNLGELCNPLKIKWTIPEDSDYSDYTLDVQIDVNYNKLNSISGIGTKPTILQTGKVVFASCSATDKELNISSTYDGWTSLSEKYQSSIWGLTGNYFDLWLRYKDSSGNYGNWVKVTINPDNSSTVIKAGLFDNGTNTTINKGYEEISGDNGEHVSGDYDNYYVNTLDDNISNNLTSLKNNYSNLVSFYKELFSFLPAEIWIILIGLVSTMVIIAIVKFVRG